MDDADQAYGLFQQIMRERETWEWADGHPMQEEESALYFLTMQFEKAVDRQDGLQGAEARWRGLQRGEDPGQAALTDLIGTGKTLTPSLLWPTVILMLPNPSNIAWAYSEERGTSLVPPPCPDQSDRRESIGRAAP